MSKNTKKNSKKNIKKSKKQNVKKTKKISIRQKGGEPDKTQESVQIEDKLFISRFMNTARDTNIFNDSTVDNKIKINNFLFQMYHKLDRDKLDKYYNSMKDKDVNTESNILNEIEIMKINNESKNTENVKFFIPKKEGVNADGKYMFKQLINDMNGRTRIFLIKDDKSFEDITITFSDSDKLILADENQHVDNINSLLTKLNDKIGKKDNNIINPFILQIIHQGITGTTSTTELNLKLPNCTGPDANNSISQNTLIIVDKPKQKIIKLNLYYIIVSHDNFLPIYIAQRSYIIGDLYIQDDDNNFVENIINNNLFFGNEVLDFRNEVLDIKDYFFKNETYDGYIVHYTENIDKFIAIEKEGAVNFFDESMCFKSGENFIKFIKFSVKPKPHIALSKFINGAFIEDSNLTIKNLYEADVVSEDNCPKDIKCNIYTSDQIEIIKEDLNKCMKNKTDSERNKLFRSLSKKFHTDKNKHCPEFMNEFSRDLNEHKCDDSHIKNNPNVVKSLKKLNDQNFLNNLKDAVDNNYNEEFKEIKVNVKNQKKQAANSVKNIDNLKKQCNLVIVNILDKNIKKYCDSLKTVKP